jgi:hypothetical protein
MRLVMIVLIAASVALSFGAEQPKYFLRAEDVVSVHAAGEQVEVVYDRSRCPGDAFPGQCGFDLSFAIDLPQSVFRQIQLVSMEYGADRITVRWRLPNAHSATALARSIEMHRSRPNQAMQRTVGRSAFPLSMTSTFNPQPHAPSPAVADLVSR